ncbi:hypothetical protein K8B83_09450 [Shewanella inventionis]|uniref:KfrA N-terminal DNA-binding domain-containing protein n=1 Tax=Shewanella inventionis TaxID=1738770 RepID=A0ABQ1JBF4_9GAMM|nr:hypothetical protein [Shewanella inventionis]MCL1158617.1 hypothetical protein [Shewanella inventionis]UAL45003.1 hypothetical protein K8B83_09450 [Shewanella inventionis]GGB62306.1 hypothetical protein GCM10011607_23840 [Shewanella inventionis]
MSPIEQVLAAAKSIAINGHTPSLALIKNRLGSRFPMPVLIQGLQQFKALPKSEWQNLPELADIPAPATQGNELDSPVAQLQQQVDTMAQLINQLTCRITELEQQFSQHIPTTPNIKAE